MDKCTYKLFFKVNLILTSLISLIFLSLNESYTFVSFFLTFLGLVSTIATLYLIYTILLFPLSFFRKVVVLLGSVLFILTDIALIVDFFIFRIYKFHINAMVLNIIFSPAALDSIQIGIAPVVVLLFLIFLLFAAQILIYKKIRFLQKEKQESINKKLNKYILLPLLIVIVTEKISYGFMSLTNTKEVLTKFRVIPLYQPLTFNSFAYKHFGLRPDKVDVKNTIAVDSSLTYPKHKIIMDNNETFNILIIASDATRYSAITPEIAPNLTQFKRDGAIDFQHHISGGNATRFGIFSLMYGINATYWFSFLDANQGSVLFDVLKQLDYEIHIISSTSTAWPEFRKTCYVNVQANIKDDFKGAPWQKDMQSSKHMIQVLENYDGKKPFFGFIFMDAPHGYSYPPEQNIFQAESQNINYLAVGKGTKENRAAWIRYKNSVHFIDSRFQKIIDTLKKKGMYENTMIIFTSDHGEEFYEYGFFGHNSAFDEAQVHVPFIVKFPKQIKDLQPKGDVVSMTSHLDIVPSLLSLLGVKNNVKDFSNGYNIFEKNYSRKFAFCNSWNYNSIITSKYTYIFSNRPDQLFQNEVRDTKTYKLLEDTPVDSKLVLEVMQQNRMFLK